MNVLFSWLFSVEGRIHYYLGSSSVLQLSCFLNGFETALKLNDPSYEDVMYPGFQRYVEQFYLPQEHAMGWARMIMAHASSDGEAMAKFFELLHQYYDTLN